MKAIALTAGILIWKHQRKKKETKTEFIHNANIFYSFLCSFTSFLPLQFVCSVSVARFFFILVSLNETIFPFFRSLWLPTFNKNQHVGIKLVKRIKLVICVTLRFIFFQLFCNYDTKIMNKWTKKIVINKRSFL